MKYDETAPSLAAPSHPNAFLTVTDASVSYGDGRAAVVQQIGFSLQKGQIGCLLGESGCGKTTMLRALAGLEPLSAGTIELAGKRIGDADHQLTPAKRGIGMVFQDYALFNHLNVLKNVVFGLHDLPKPQRIKRAMDMLELVGLAHLADRRIAQLSGGQQQRVALARALAPEPDLLLLDEPFSNLDTVLRQSLASKVREILKAAQTTALLVTHDQQEAFAMCDVVGVMQAGKLSQWDTPEALYHKPASASVAGFIGEGSFISGRVTSGMVVSVLGGYRLDDVSMCAGASDFSEGQAVQLFVRPEYVVCGSFYAFNECIGDENTGKGGAQRTGADSALVVTAQVAARTFRGAHTLYKLKLSSGELLLGFAPSQQRLVDVGGRIEVFVRLDTSAVF